MTDPSHRLGFSGVIRAEAPSPQEAVETLLTLAADADAEVAQGRHWGDG